ncbi:hypothetical protein C0Q70_01674 [Pomacea canaliculata]|uniref:Axin-1 n=1 Tax=Pomacea canaliculata TaxID=400727 RepID=A0A2T7Q080_POMCA|nr:hypothetical protein C0Q70_01674 [Pomacea canaliculata]
MTSKVFEFLNDSGGNNFTETAPRPPVPGEENELQSNGGMSTRSSGSHKSQVSNKSHASSKSAASTKGEISHSPAATPRKSNLDRGEATGFPLCHGFETEDVEAPLGFEPEGSAANSPPYSENSTPPHLKWAENLNHLLTDSDGVSLFKEYLECEQGGADELQFWFACQGLKQQADTGDVANIVNAIYKKYVRVDKVKSISKETRKEIMEKIQQKVKVDQCIFDAAQAEVENHFRNVSYPAFLNSDIYVQYVQSYADSPKSSHSSGSNSARPVSQSVLLPVLHEDKELATDELSSTMGVPLINKISGGRRSELTSLRHNETVAGFYYFTRPHCSSYPAHVSYAPVSAQDSEQQSLSSDALTDDTVSLTDTSSIDGNMPYGRKQQRRKAMKSSFAIPNREYRTDLHTQIIPRTQRVPNNPNIAETDPERFAQLLREKLEKEIKDRESVVKMEEKLKALNQEENVNISFAKNTTATSFILSLPSEEETAESILDQHCSRIWASSHHTPSRTPGRMSPHSKSPDRTFARPKAKVMQQTVNTAASAAAVAVLSVNTSFQRSYHRSNRREPTGLSKSFDSGVGDDKNPVVRGEMHRHIHHHHHHHHSRDISGKQRMELETQQINMAYWREGSTCVDHSRGRTTNVKKNVVRKGSDASSNIDSGINMGFDRDSSRVVPNWNNPSSEKVMKWMLQSETIISDTGTGSADTDRSSSHKRSHRYSSGIATSQPYKQSSKTKTGTHTSSRSTSVERSGMHAWGVAGVGAPVLPGQPFVQDSNMPPLTPPNPTTQLEEAKRRLKSLELLYQSFAGVPVKDKSRCAMPILSTYIPSARTVPSDLDASTTMPEYSQRPQKPPGNSVQGDTTVVGMYYEQEPIPYRFTLPGRTITLAQVRALNTKKGSYKYFFKRDSNEFGDGAVFEEIDDDSKVLPMWDGKIVAKLSKVD